MRKIIFCILIIVFVLVCVCFSYAWGKKVWFFGIGKYQAVQLVSGEVYYGKLAHFPCLKLKNVYFIQQTQGAESATSTVQLAPLSSLFFGPENEMHLQKSQIIWWADLSKDSEVFKMIKEAESK